MPANHATCVRKVLAMNSNTPTPETDAQVRGPIRLYPYSLCETEVVVADFARKLERERDEARQALKLQTQNYISLYESVIGAECETSNEKDVNEIAMRHRVEIDQLRKVCDELAEELKVWWKPLPKGFFHPDNPIGQKSYSLEAYNQLPHVKEKTK